MMRILLRQCLLTSLLKQKKVRAILNNKKKGFNCDACVYVNNLGHESSAVSKVITAKQSSTGKRAKKPSRWLKYCKNAPAVSKRVPQPVVSYMIMLNYQH